MTSPGGTPCRPRESSDRATLTALETDICEAYETLRAARTAAFHNGDSVFSCDIALYDLHPLTVRQLHYESDTRWGNQFIDALHHGDATEVTVPPVTAAEATESAHLAFPSSAVQPTETGFEITLPSSESLALDWVESPANTLSSADYVSITDWQAETPQAWLETKQPSITQRNFRTTRVPRERPDRPSSSQDRLAAAIDTLSDEYRPGSVLQVTLCLIGHRDAASVSAHRGRGIIAEAVGDWFGIETVRLPSLGSIILTPNQNAVALATYLTEALQEPDPPADDWFDRFHGRILDYPSEAISFYAEHNGNRTPAGSYMVEQATQLLIAGEIDALDCYTLRTVPYVVPGTRPAVQRAISDGWQNVAALKTYDSVHATDQCHTVLSNVSSELGAISRGQVQQRVEYWLDEGTDTKPALLS